MSFLQGIFTKNYLEKYASDINFIIGQMSNHLTDRYSSLFIVSPVKIAMI